MYFRTNHDKTVFLKIPGKIFQKCTKSLKKKEEKKNLKKHLFHFVSIFKSWSQPDSYNRWMFTEQIP